MTATITTLTVVFDDTLITLTNTHGAVVRQFRPEHTDRVVAGLDRAAAAEGKSVFVDWDNARSAEEALLSSLRG